MMSPCRCSLRAVCIAAALGWAHPAGAQDSEPSASATDDAAADAAGSTETPDAKPAPSQEDVKRAGSHFERGLQLYNDAEYRLALIEFERAYQLVPNYRVKYNIAQVSIQIGRYAHALRALEAYLEQGGDKISSERRTQVEADLKMLAGRTARVAVTSNVEGAEILLDDSVVAQTPLPDPLLIDAGEHRLMVRHRGYQPRTEQVTLAGGDELEVNLELVPIKKADPVVIVKEVPNQQQTGPGVDRGVEEDEFPYATVGWVATGVLAVGAVVSGVVGLTAKRELDSLAVPDPDQDDNVRQDMDDAAKKAQTWFLVSDILTGTAVVAGAASLYLTLSGTDQAATPAARTSASIQLRAGVGLNQLWLKGRF
jgi:hypothetical protein